MNFDPRRVPDSEKKAKGNYAPIPKDLYKMEIVRSEIGSNGKSGHPRLNIGWVVLEGEHERRWVWDDLPLSGSEKATAYGRGALARLCEAVGMSTGFQHESELRGQWAWVHVYIDNFDGKDRNKVGGYQTKPIAHGQAPGGYPTTQSPQTPRPPQQPQHTTMNPQETQDRYGGGQAPPQQQAPPGPQQGYYNDDDIPF